MPFSRRLLQVLTSSVLIGLSVSCGSDSGSPTDPPLGQQPVVKDAAVVVDSGVLVLLSDSLERAGGTYRFRTVGSPVPTIEPGKVIVGAQGPGFLRRVSSVSTSGHEITVMTTRAALTDVLERGSFQTTVQMVSPSGSPGSLSGGSSSIQYGVLEADYLASGVTYSAGALSLKDTDLCKELLSGSCPDWVKLTIPEGSITFDPGVDIGGSIDGADIETFHAIATGALSLDLSVKAEATKEFTAKGSKKLADVSKRFVARVGPLPVAGVVKVTYTVGYDASATLETSYRIGASATSQMAAGSRYAATSGWTDVWDGALQTQQKPTEWKAQASGTVRVYVRPHVQVLFYDVVGPFMTVEPYLKGEAHVGTQQCEMSVSAGIDSKLGMKIEILGFKLNDHAKDFTGTPLPILDYPCPIGTLKVTTVTTGTNPDPDGYTVTLDGGDPKSIGATGEVTYIFLPESTFSVQLEDVANNCTVGGQNPRPATILAGDTTTANFNVECTADTGTLEVSVATTGSTPDPDGYSVVVDGTQSMPIGTNGTVTFEDIGVGTHSVSLEGLANNCTVGGQNPVSVNVVLGATTPVSFPISCDVSQQIAVTTQTTGSPPDPDGYTVSLDGGPAEPIAGNGTWIFSDVAVGPHSLLLDDLAGHCAVQGSNPQTVVVTAGTDATATFDVLCTTGSLTVQAATSGPAADIDPDGYTVTVDGTLTQHLDVNGSISFPSLTTGSHSVELSGVDDPCIVTSFNPQTVQVPGTVTFSVDCGGSGGLIALVTGNALKTMNPDGTDVTTIFQDFSSGSGRWPSWSPDGSRFAFQRIGAIYAIDADGSNLVQLTIDPDPSCTERCWAGDTEPDYSPDGSQVAFSRREYDTNVNGWTEAIFVVPAAGGTITQLTSFAGSLDSTEPSWSPDGSQMVFSGQEWTTNSQNLYVMSTSGGAATNLTNLTSNVLRAAAPIWSPDGSRIAFLQTDYQSQFGLGPTELRLIDPAGGLSTLVLTIADGDSINRKMTWSPDGTQIMFVGVINGQLGIFVVGADGSDLTLVNGDGVGTDPDWSP